MENLKNTLKKSEQIENKTLKKCKRKNQNIEEKQGGNFKINLNN